ncbi:MAG TPA: CPBP family glutamic-type intramembrane protease [Gemmataceae bacterium]|nr:CPBP family glutamic-type intramembrane protease [Gemmataceae bacterium]
MRHHGYLGATRHPWPCFLFVLPLLVAYEAGVLWLGGTQPDALRNGADAWLRWGLETFGLSQLYWTPGLVALLFLSWSWLRFRDRPDDLLGVLTGMAVESVAFAVGLWGLSRAMEPLLNQLAVAGPGDELIGRTVTFLGAGIYEEVLFRLLLFSGLARLLRHVELPGPLAVGLAAVASAALFAAAHHVGPYGETFQGGVFLFRMAAGMYFAALFRLRGFGIAAGAHACYDVLVGALVS